MKRFRRYCQRVRTVLLLSLCAKKPRGVARIQTRTQLVVITDDSMPRYQSRLLPSLTHPLTHPPHPAYPIQYSLFIMSIIQISLYSHPAYHPTLFICPNLDDNHARTRRSRFTTPNPSELLLKGTFELQIKSKIIHTISILTARTTKYSPP